MKKPEFINSEYERLIEEEQKEQVEAIQLLTQTHGAKAVNNWLIAKSSNLSLNKNEN